MSLPRGGAVVQLFLQNSEEASYFCVREIFTLHSFRREGIMVS